VAPARLTAHESPALLRRHLDDGALTRLAEHTTVRGIIVGLDPGLRTLALHGDTVYRDRFELVYRRAPAPPNEQRRPITRCAPACPRRRWPAGATACNTAL